MREVIAVERISESEIQDYRVFDNLQRAQETLKACVETYPQFTYRLRHIVLE